MERVHEQRRPRRHERPETDSAERTRDTTEQLKHDLDDILDEIDAVLEQNAEEFVKAYVQKGGE
jgi:ubiquitin-like protein Pup